MEALEDDFCDILSKAMRGLNLDVPALAAIVEESPDDVRAWRAGPSFPEDGVIIRLAEVLGLRADCLIASAHQTWHPNIELPASVSKYRQIPHVSNGYVVQSGTALAIVDPAGNAVEAFAAIEQRGGQLDYILITHRHADHYDAALQVLERYPQATLLIHAIEKEAVPALHDFGQTVSHGQQFPFGSAGLLVHVIAGHVDGLTCFQTREGVFVGDAIFAGSIGANNGPITGYQEQRSQLYKRLFILDDQLLLFPGHGPITRIGLERQHNPFL